MIAVHMVCKVTIAFIAPKEHVDRINQFSAEWTEPENPKSSKELQ